MDLRSINSKYVYIPLVTVILGLVVGYFFRDILPKNSALKVLQEVTVELSDKTAIAPLDDDIYWLGLQILVSMSGEEKIAFKDYTMMVQMPGSDRIYDLIDNQTGDSYILPLWPLSVPGDYRFFITPTDRIDSKALEYSLYFSGVIEKKSTYSKLDNGKYKLTVDGIGFEKIDDIYRVTGESEIEQFSYLRDNGGVLDSGLADGYHVFVFRVGSQWYYTGISIIQSAQVEIVA